jgi:predicted homoserine dehydrogenase-like protein
VLEWLKRHAWKACIPQKGIRGSNPCLSATNAENQQIAKQTPSFTPKNVKSGVFVLFKIIQPLHNKRVAILKESDEKRLIFIYPFSLIFQDFTSS